MAASYEAIWNAGRAITGGFGFWGHSGLLSRFSGPKDMVRTWVDGLRANGYMDIDIVFYGDWTDARHIADQIEPNTTYAQFKREVIGSARDAEIVAEENRSTYATAQPKRWEMAQRALHGEVVSPGDW